MIAFLFFNILLSFDHTPPGTARVKNYFVDKKEIQNIDWLEFLYYKRFELDSSEIKKLLLPNPYLGFRCVAEFK